ncbi:HDIG domain-containing protein [Clostridium botulinum D/C]|uniref:HDIG domain-containing metalloprotein n=1 Tax=Clostridium botulinum TaxID=1491 RepID=UPI001E2E675A|nr:HDIG domain-containing metalloprotein [Clostridium botulinum]MCD3300404.1 HDIG domain-containing protein [Clostridium botulinum D/C]MCD3306790.1 HDIG domain-containing protein [Clostridium botulinum D/C]MCD3321860.1 HDIG domain-containing protein [Clostridium botulinum D/C]MCD3324713.1 HDIG domain-containing protein [Clostridium botulinum D/C]MCD3327337.1 HDIG domain-containing protein [Clostridium botulinum D/C]
MFFYRIKQFYMAITATIMPNDEKLLEKYLNKQERDLFNKLSMNEKAHSVRVAKDIIKVCMENKLNKEYFVKVALLHDIGKIQVNLNIFEKATLVILNKISKGKLKILSNIRKINIYYNHGKIGAEILRKQGYDERFLYLVKNHHNNDIIEDMDLKILKECDDRN